MWTDWSIIVFYRIVRPLSKRPHGLRGLSGSQRQTGWNFARRIDCSQPSCKYARYFYKTSRFLTVFIEISGKSGATFRASTWHQRLRQPGARRPAFRKTRMFAKVRSKIFPATYVLPLLRCFALHVQISATHTVFQSPRTAASEGYEDTGKRQQNWKRVRVRHSRCWKPVSAFFRKFRRKKKSLHFLMV